MSRCVERHDRMGLLHPAVDVHTLGVSSMEQLLRQCGIQVVVADRAVCGAVELDDAERGTQVLARWLRDAGITVLGFSYRLNPEDGERLFARLVGFLRQGGLLAQAGGPVKAVFFAGLPDTCARVVARFPDLVSGVFLGDETLWESLEIMGIPARDRPPSLTASGAYDERRMAFGRGLVRKADYRYLQPVPRAYPGAGGRGDTLLARVAHGRAQGLPPLMRAHVGPYLSDRKEAVAMFLEWTRALARSGLLDVLSIGSSQLTQEAFGEDWKDRANGGGVPLNSPQELAEVWQAARPMLVRIYAGTRDLERMARIHEATLDIAWHALSLWWFSAMDGRGPNPVRANLAEHLATMRAIAATGKPVETNIPHHFAFRGGDDLTFILSGYLGALAAKQSGIRDYVLQVMLNTPKPTWGIQDLAKARALLRLVRGLEGPSFRVLLQPRGGLDYFSHDEAKAKAQLAAVTAMMDDIEPLDAGGPPIIHVVSYTEAVRLADPPVVDESIRITRQALLDYRRLKRAGHMDDLRDNADLEERTAFLVEQATVLIRAIATTIPDPGSAQGLYDILAAGYFALPYLWECRSEFPAATRWRTQLVDGGMRIVDAGGKPIGAQARVAIIAEGRAHAK